MNRIYLSSPHMPDQEQRLAQEVSATNWIAPLWPQVDALEFTCTCSHSA